MSSTPGPTWTQPKDRPRTLAPVPQTRWHQPPSEAQPLPASPVVQPALSPQGVGPAPVGMDRRFKGWLIDKGIGEALVLVGYICVSTATPTLEPGAGPTSGLIAGLVLLCLGLAVLAVTTVVGRWIVGGSTGQSWGRRWAGTRLISQTTGQPIGAGMTIVRDLAHYLDNQTSIGWLLPLWNERSQTIADMLCSTIVVDAADAPLAAPPPVVQSPIAQPALRPGASAPEPAGPATEPVAAPPVGGGLR